MIIKSTGLKEIIVKRIEEQYNVNLHNNIGEIIFTPYSVTIRVKTCNLDEIYTINDIKLTGRQYLDELHNIFYNDCSFNHYSTYHELYIPITIDYEEE